MTREMKLSLSNISGIDDPPGDYNDPRLLLLQQALQSVHRTCHSPSRPFQGRSMRAAPLPFCDMKCIRSIIPFLRMVSMCSRIP